MDNASLLTPAEILTATRTAAREVAVYQRSVVRTAVRRDHKLDKHDLVTEHDRRCEQIATASLRAAFPAAQIVGEEYGVQPPAPATESTVVTAEGTGMTAEGAGLTFFIDPIDGTSNFVAGMPTFAVSIGAALDGELVAGVVNAPMLGHEFYAGAGLGAWVASFDTEGPVQLGEARNRMAGECLVLTGFPNARDLGQWGPEGGELARALQRDVMAVRNVGSSAIELAFVAAGWVDGCYGTTAGPWDLAAGFLLVREAGGRLSHAQLLGGTGGTDIWEHPGYAASGPGRALEQVHSTIAGLEQIAATRRG